MEKISLIYFSGTGNSLFVAQQLKESLAESELVPITSQVNSDSILIRNKKIVDKQKYIENLAQFIAGRRITIEVCLTSNQQTIPELRDNLERHPFRHMRKSRLSVTFCTDNRLVSRTGSKKRQCSARYGYG